jgi:hypothetical protein
LENEAFSAITAEEIKTSDMTIPHRKWIISKSSNLPRLAVSGLGDKAGLYKRAASLVGSPGRDGHCACWRRPADNTSLLPGNRRAHIINSDYAVDYFTPPVLSL